MRVERSSAPIDETRYIVLDCFWDVLSLVSLGYPLRIDFCLCDIESFLENLIQINLWELTCQNLWLWAQSKDILLNFLQSLRGNKISLIDNHKICNFQLIYHQFCQCRFLLFLLFLTFSLSPFPSIFLLFFFLCQIIW